MKPLEQIYGKLSALTFLPSAKSAKALVLLHGVGSNADDLFELAPLLSEDRMLVSLRAPIVMAPKAFAWFHVQFTEQGPVHNWPEAKEALTLIEEALVDLSKKSGIALNNISVFGFSQGAIMTLGLALTSKLNLESYIASSGRTLPEFAQVAKNNPLSDYEQRKVYVTHGIQDSRLPIHFARDTDKILKSTKLKLTYKEYNSEHTISQEVIADTKKWLGSQ